MSTNKTKASKVINGFALIKADTFYMGSPSGETGRDDDEEQHKVTLTHDFYMYPLTLTPKRASLKLRYCNRGHFTRSADTINFQ